MSEQNLSELTDHELVILNNLLTKEVENLQRKLDKDNDPTSTDIGNKSLKELVSMYQIFQQELNSRSLT